MCVIPLYRSSVFCFFSTSLLLPFICSSVILFALLSVYLTQGKELSLPPASSLTVPRGFALQLCTSACCICTKFRKSVQFDSFMLKFHNISSKLHKPNFYAVLLLLISKYHKKPKLFLINTIMLSFEAVRRRSLVYL